MKSTAAIALDPVSPAGERCSFLKRWAMLIGALRRARPLLPLIALLVPPGPLAAGEIRVAVASNFRPAMDELAARFGSDAGHEVLVIAGSTGKHYAQIVNGAPYDAFFAADAERPRRLERERRIVPGSRFTYALGRLVLWSPSAGFVDPQGEVLRTGSFEHLAIANPRLAPYGAAARQVLQSLGRWEPLAGKLVRGENIAQAFQFVASGNADLGFVSKAQLNLPGRSFGGSAWEPPQSLYDPIDQQAVLLRNSAAAEAFMRFVRSPQARALIRTYGYDVPDVQ